MILCLLFVLTLKSIFAATDSVPAFYVENDELLEMSKRLRQADENKAKLGQIALNFQGHTNARDVEDQARWRLFSKVDSSLLRKPSYSQFLALENNYNRETGVAEPRVSITEDKRETSAFLTTILNTKPWRLLYEFLHQKGHPFAKDPVTFRYWIAQLWFAHYSRARGRADTSGFEHVFMGEAKNNEISGMHNWLRFYTLERDAAEDFDYKGFIIKRGNVMAAVKFTWKGDTKRTGSLLIGTSPEFDMALYTLCFLSRRGRDQCEVELDGCPLYITSYELVQNNKAFIGSIFPSAGRLTDTCRRFGG